MQNNFEKQVRDKMDELRFDPTDPVWQQVQWRIARKKDRRRLLFWLPLLFLLLGGGAWWLWQGGGQKQISVHQNSEVRNVPAQPKENKPALPADTDNAGKGIENKITIPVEQGVAAGTTKTATSSSEAPVRGSNNAASVRSRVGNGAMNSRGRANVAKSNKRSASAPLIPGSDDGARVQGPVTGDPQDASGQPSASTAGTEKKPHPSAIQEGAELTFNTPASQAEKKSTKTSWQLGLTASVGVSGVSTGMGLFAQRSAADFGTVPNAGTSGQPLMLYEPAPAGNGLSLTGGVVLSRSLSERVRIYTGLEYRYFSTSQPLGVYVVQDTVLSNGSRVEGYYRASGFSMQEHQNQFHFIALPVSISWKVSRKIPLQVEGGLSVQQMIGSNAVSYDNGSQVFYKNDSQLQKTALASKLALNYAFFEKSRVGLLLGPEFQWSITPLQKTGTKDRLVSLGLNARLFFQKK